MRSVLFTFLSGSGAVVAVTATGAAVSSALNGFSIFLIPDHAPDDQPYDHYENCKYDHCSHNITS